jgi:hypothetical protein
MLAAIKKISQFHISGGKEKHIFALLKLKYETRQV